MDLTALAQALEAMGCPAAKCEEMAVLLEKRAKHLASERGQAYEQTMAHLIALMRQGWAAKERGL